METTDFFTCVHGKNFVIIEHFGDELLIFPKDIVVECPGCQGQFFRLGFQSIHDLWVTVALVDCTVSTQKVKILPAFNIPHVNTWENKPVVSTQNKKKDIRQKKAPQT